ncbi:MAG: flagellar hook-length control protein FliK [Treponemataceae bacterium]|nr:flagellar hook-length control protein FliK [Treponemataceae bacterium]
MQTMNLRFEQMVNTAQSIPSEKVQGSNFYSQNDSSFTAALEKAQKELDSEKPVEQERGETPSDKEIAVETKDGTKVSEEKIDSQVKNLVSEDSDQEKVSEYELKWLNSEAEDLFAQEESENFILDTEVASDLKSFQDLLDAKNLAERENGNLATENSLDLENLLELSEKSIEADFSKIQTSVKEIAEDANLIPEEKTGRTEKKLSDNELIYAILSGQSAEVEEKNVQPVNEKIENPAKKNVRSEKVENPKISVIDERTPQFERRNVDKLVTTIEKTGDSQVEMTMNLDAKAQNSIQFDGNVQSGNQVPGNSRFAQMLSQQLQTNSVDFVRAGSLILKDNNKGTINLVLHPEDLGNVKIQLEMTDKLIAGKIVVATKEAYDAFNENMNSLRNAFIEQGFDAPSFDLSWSGEEKKNPQNENRNMYGAVYEERVPDVDDEMYGSEVALNALMYGSSIMNVIA